MKRDIAGEQGDLRAHLRFQSVDFSVFAFQFSATPPSVVKFKRLVTLSVSFVDLDVIASGDRTPAEN